MRFLTNTVIFGGLLISSVAIAADLDESAGISEASTSDTFIPMHWGEFYIEENLLEPHMGDDVKEVCYEDDFEDETFVQGKLQVRSTYRSGPGRIGQWENRSSRSSKSRFNLLDSVTDFVVADVDTLIIKTPLAGAHIVTMKEEDDCAEALSYARHLVFTDNYTSKRRSTCLKSKRSGVRFSVRNLLPEYGEVVEARRVYDAMYTCEIKSIKSWQGEFNMQALIEASMIQRAETTNSEISSEKIER